MVETLAKVSFQITLSEVTALQKVAERLQASKPIVVAALISYLIDEMPLNERQYIVRIGGALASQPWSKRQTVPIDDDVHHLFRLAAGLTHGNMQKAARGLCLWASTLEQEELAYLIKRKSNGNRARWEQLREESFEVR